MRLLKEEVQCLQEAMGRMREQLGKEKRLNASIKQKKVHCEESHENCSILACNLYT